MHCQSIYDSDTEMFDGKYKEFARRKFNRKERNGRCPKPLPEQYLKDRKAGFLNLCFLDKFGAAGIMRGRNVERLLTELEILSFGGGRSEFMKGRASIHLSIQKYWR